MMALYSVISGIAGAFLGILPLSLDGHFVFLQKVTETVYGTGNFSIGNDTVFLVCFGVFVALFVSFYEKIVDIIKTKDYKELAICLSFYLPALLVNAFFESSVMLSAFVFLNAFVVYASDYIEKTRFNGKNSIYITATATFLGGLAGFSEIALIFSAGLLTGKKPKQAINYALILYIPIMLLKTFVYLIKACIFGFTLNFGYSLIVFVLSALMAIFLIAVLKKTALKRNFRLYAYYLALFAVVVIYTFMKG